MTIAAGGLAGLSARLPSLETALTWFTDALMPGALRVVLILIGAAVTSRVLRRLVKHGIARILSDEDSRVLGAFRAKAPASTSGVARPSRMSQRADTVEAVLGSLVTTLVWTVAVLLVMSEFGVNIAPLLAGAGIAGVALGFGAQKLVQDYIAGIFIVLEDHFGIGDLVDTGEAVGTVEAFTLRSTRLRDLDGVVWHVANGQITRTGNLSQQWARAVLDVGVAYDTDLDHAVAVLGRVLGELAADPDFAGHVLETPEVWGVEAFGPSEITIRSVMKVEPGTQFAVNRELRRRLKEAFDAEGITIPFPQRTLWIQERGGDTDTPEGGGAA